MFYKTLFRCSLTRIKNMFCTQLTGKIGLFFFLNQISPEIFDEKMLVINQYPDVNIELSVLFNNKIFNNNSHN